jgi:hypothetical protein
LRLRTLAEATQFLQAVGGIAWEPESGFKALLDTLDQALAFSLA